jgi:hypothetical protein
MTTHRTGSRPDLETHALPMLNSVEPGEDAAAEVGVPYLRIVDGRPTIIHPNGDA